MGSCSSAVIGILLLALTITVGLSVLGVWANADNGTPKDNFALPFTPEKNPLNELTSQEIPSEIKQSDGLCSEVSEGAFLGLCEGLVPECGCLGRFDTVPGTLTIIDENLPAPNAALPLCINNDWLSQYYIVVESIGGYTPECGVILLNQLKQDNQCFEGVIDATFTAMEVQDSCPCAVDYKVTFTTENPICLDSNHLPVGFDQQRTLGKWVDVSYCTTWKGCHLDSQKFTVILAHKAVSQNSKLPIIITSPV
jgi:hypothetical protein